MPSHDENTKPGPPLTPGLLFLILNLEDDRLYSLGNIATIQFNSPGNDEKYATIFNRLRRFKERKELELEPDEIRHTKKQTRYWWYGATLKNTLFEKDFLHALEESTGFTTMEEYIAWREERKNLPVLVGSVSPSRAETRPADPELQPEPNVHFEAETTFAPPPENQDPSGAGLPQGSIVCVSRWKPTAKPHDRRRQILWLVSVLFLVLMGFIGANVPQPGKHSTPDFRIHRRPHTLMNRTHAGITMNLTPPKKTQARFELFLPRCKP